MPHSGLYLNQVATVPGACKVEPTGSQSILPPIKQVRVRNSASSSTSNSITVRPSCNPRSQSSVIDAEPVVEASCWRVDPSFLVAEELPGWENVTAKSSAPSVEEPSKEVHSRTFRENVQDDVERSSTSEEIFLRNSDEEASTTSRSSRRGQNKRRSFYSRPDMIRWRLVVEGVRNPIDKEHNPNRNFRTSQHLQDVILFLESLGLDSSKMMAKYPSLSTCSVENIRAVVKFLDSNKLRRKDVVKILNNNPFLLGHSVEVNFLPVVMFLLTEVGLQEKDVGKVINRCARMLTASVENQLRPTLRFLQALGFNHMSVVVSNNATLLASSVENRLIPKMEFLIGLGLSKEEAVQALIRFPAIFNYSIEKNLQPKFIYLMEDMGRGLADLRAFPQFFGYSLEYRIRPRYLFLKKRNLSLPLADLLKPTDEVFYARFQHEKLVQEKEPSFVS